MLILITTDSHLGNSIPINPNIAQFSGTSPCFASCNNSPSHPSSISLTPPVCYLSRKHAPFHTSHLFEMMSNENLLLIAGASKTYVLNVGGACTFIASGEEDEVLDLVCTTSKQISVTSQLSKIYCSTF